MLGDAVLREIASGKDGILLFGLQTCRSDQLLKWSRGV
jgi:hypothetical protein